MNPQCVNLETIPATEFVLQNDAGMKARLINYGATLVSLKVPDQSATEIELTLGFDTLAEYLAHPFYFGCTVGRVANRIANGQFHYQNKRYRLACNENAFSHLHGGDKGFDKVMWAVRSLRGNGIEFSYLSKDGEENYPGNLLVKASYFLTSANELKIIYTAETDQPTPVNLTNHTYWNLAGADATNILNHELQIFSAEYLETDNQHMPTGKILSVADTEFDFRRPRTIGTGGYDHCYVTGNTDKKIHLVARARDPGSQRTLETYTTQAGLQFYSGNYLRDYALAGGKRTAQWGGFCLETQGFPDAVNQPNFPPVMLLPGEIYSHETIYKIIF